MIHTFDYKFTTASGRIVFVPSKSARHVGQAVVTKVLHRWTPPAYFFHFQPGGHVAAAQVHMGSNSFVRLDLTRFFDSVTRTKVHRAMRAIGFRQRYSWKIACESTVSKDATGYSLPFGFIQSPVLASMALDKSALGQTLKDLSATAIKLSVFMDDIIVSGPDAASLVPVRTTLEQAATLSGFAFNPAKSTYPAPRLTVFNLDLGHGSLSVTVPRMGDFKAAINLGNSATAQGILSYVASVNTAQEAELAGL